MATPEAVLAFASEVTAMGADWQLHAYGNTMHAFTNPKAMRNFFDELFDAGD